MEISLMKLLVILSAMGVELCSPRWRKTFNDLVEKECECFCDSRSKIVGGNEVEDKATYPFVVAFTLYNKFLCGGILITPKHVLTAAHCIEQYHPITNIEVIFGSLNYHETETVIYAKEAVIHEEYVEHTLVNDIGIITLVSNVNYTNCIKPACLPRSLNESYDGRKLTVIGYGAQYFLEANPDGKLRRVKVHVIALHACKDYYKHEEYLVLGTNLCAGYERGMKDSCSGDSGGPIIAQNKGVLSVVGIVSWGIGCARKKKPGVYTKIDQYIEWIENKVGHECLCFHDS